MMNPKTTTARALAGTLLAAPAAPADEEVGEPPTPLRASLAGHPTVEDQMRSVARENRKRDRRRAAARRARRRAAQAPPPVSPALQAIAACESGGNPRAIGGGGLYRGKYQFDFATWRSVGGSGDPAAAPEAEQDRRAAILYARAGASPWPVCGR